MDDTTYKKALDVAVTEFRKLESRQREIKQELEGNESRLVRLRQTINGLRILLGKEENPLSLGFTDAIRHVLRGSQSAMSPKQIRDALIYAGFDVSKYENPLASIHTIVKRLRKMGEVDEIGFGGPAVYRWLGPKELRFAASDAMILNESAKTEVEKKKK